MTTPKTDTVWLDIVLGALSEMKNVTSDDEVGDIIYENYVSHDVPDGCFALELGDVSELAQFIALLCIENDRYLELAKDTKQRALAETNFVYYWPGWKVERDETP